MTSGDVTKPSLKARAETEMREFLAISAYFFVYLSALLYLKSAILHDNGIAFAPFGIALVKALLCGKFVLLGRMIHIGDRFKERPLVWPTLYKSMAFLVFLTALNALEEIVMGFIHHHTVAETLSHVEGGTLDQLVATSFIGMLILCPFFAFQSLGELLGQRNLLRVFFQPRHVPVQRH